MAGRGAWARRVPLLAVLAGNAASSVGTAMTMLAVPWFVLHITGSPASTGLVTAAQLVGLVLAGLMAGAVVDAVGARRTAWISDLLAAALVVAIPLGYTAGLMPLWLLATLTFLLGATRGPGRDARVVMIPELAEHAGTSLQRANSGVDLAFRMGAMLGAPLAGVLIALWGAPAVLYLDGLSFLLAATLVLLAVPVRLLAGASGESDGTAEPDGTGDRAHGGPLGQARYVADGLRYLGGHRLLRAIAALAMVANLLDAGSNAVLLPVYTQQVLHSPAALGSIVGAFGVGAVTGTALYGWRGHRLPRWPLFASGILLVGAPRFWVLALEPGTLTLVLVYGLCGLATGPINPVLRTVQLEVLPRRMRARVIAASHTLVLAGTPLGGIIAGFSVELAGLRPAVLGFGLCYLLVTLTPWVFRVWRGLDPERRPAVEVASEHLDHEDEPGPRQARSPESVRR